MPRCRILAGNCNSYQAIKRGDGTTTMSNAATARAIPTGVPASAEAIAKA